MPIPGLDAIGGASGLAPVAPAMPAHPADDAQFASAVTGVVDELQRLQSTSNELAVAAVTGDLTDIHSAMIASTRASVTLELVAAVRNKGVEAFTEIMRMQA